jgi:hypothetical protein
MRKNSLTLALVGLLATPWVLAAEPVQPTLTVGEKPAAPKMGDICRGLSKFDCNLIGAGLTVKEIYQKGWRVVAAYYIPTTGLQNLIIEEQ